MDASIPPFSSRFRLAPTPTKKTQKTHTPLTPFIPTPTIKHIATPLTDRRIIMAAYNGHKNWNHWNVSLWINNDEGLYRMARNYIMFKQRSYTRDQCAEAMLSELNDQGITHTPDGARYTKTTIRAAMVGM